jgi:choline dehydrogenase-like flavoprotein
MIITHAEGRLRILLIFWLILFMGGVIVMGVAAWLTAGSQLYTKYPLLAITWVGQLLLFLCTFYLLSGIRDNELTAPVIAWYKLVSGTAMMLLLLSRGPASGSALPVIGGGLLDYVMGGLTFVLWLNARRSRVLRMPQVYDAEPGVAEETTGLAARALRLSLAVCAGIFIVTSLSFLVAGLFFLAPQDATFKIAAGNAVAVYAALAFLSMLAAKAPRRRAYAQDIVVLVSLFAAFALVFWTLKFQLSSTTRNLFLIGATGHFTLAITTVILSAVAAHKERPKLFFGPWLHRVFEHFSEVILKGDIEVVTPREITDAADALLAAMPSRRIVGLKGALIFIELGSLLFRLRVPMSRMGRLEREAYLTSVFQRGRGVFRDLIKIKQLVFLIYYTDERTYKEIDYTKFEERGKYKTAKISNKLPTGAVKYPPPVNGRELETDICVIGSGAGGAVVATRLAEAGKRVVILEEGPFLRRDRIDHDERAMQLKAYREGGLQLTVDFDMYVLQGRCVGGSTFVNNGICFDLPDHVFKEWQNLGVNLNRNNLKQSLQRVRNNINITKLGQNKNYVEKGSLKFAEGCRKLGLSARWFEVNLDGCIGCGHCTIGCPYEKKMSVDLSYIPRALNAGAILVSDCKATRITTKGSKAQTVECRLTDGTPLKVKAKNIVVACGAIGSSLLLLRSGIKHNVGTRLSFNAGSWVFAEFPEPIDSFDGIQMCAYHEEPGYFLETIAMSPGSFAAAMPGWFRDHFDKMRRYRYFAIAGALVGTLPTGRVKPSPLPFLREMISPIDFKLSVSGLCRLREGVRRVCEIFLKAGAIRVIPATFNPLEFIHPSQLHQLEEFVVEPDDISFGSAHPQGGNPMSDDKKLGAVDSQFCVHGFENLFVCDASVFPSSIQVNPMLTIMALADYASCIIAKK